MAQDSDAIGKYNSFRRISIGTNNNLLTVKYKYKTGIQEAFKTMPRAIKTRHGFENFHYFNGEKCGGRF